MIDIIIDIYAIKVMFSKNKQNVSQLQLKMEICYLYDMFYFENLSVLNELLQVWRLITDSYIEESSK